MNRSPELKEDLHALVRHAQLISSYTDEEAEEALLAAREQRLDPDETILLQAKVVSALSGSARQPMAGPTQQESRANRPRIARPALPRLSMPRLRSVPQPKLAGALAIVLFLPLAGLLAANLAPKSPEAGDLAGAHGRAFYGHVNGNGALDGTFRAGQKSGDFPDNLSPLAASRPHASGHVAATPISGVPSDVIQSDTLTIRVPRHRASHRASQLEGIAKSVGGAVSSRSSNDSGADIEVTVTVPAYRFYAVLQQVYPLGHVEYENLTSQDVTLQEINLGARITNLQTQRTILLALFGKATNVSATIHVQQVLSGVQSQIDQLQAEMRYLSHRTSTSTITVDFVTHKPASNVPRHKSSPNPVVKALSDAGAAMTNVFTGLIVLLGYAIPLAVIGLVVVGLFILGRRLFVRPSTA